MTVFRASQVGEGERIRITVDGVSVDAIAGEPLAAVLLRCAPMSARTHPVSGEPRGPYCMMGVCFDCLAIVDGVASTQTCLVAARDGMTVERQHGPEGSGHE